MQNCGRKKAADPFWTLTLKPILDRVRHFAPLVATFILYNSNYDKKNRKHNKKRG